MPITSTMKVCIVCGTGSNGTLTLADTANSALPASARNAIRAASSSHEAAPFVPVTGGHRLATSV